MSEIIFNRVRCYEMFRMHAYLFLVRSRGQIYSSTLIRILDKVIKRDF